MPEEPKVGKPARILLSLGGGVAFTTTIYLLISGSPGSASLAGTFTLALLVFAYLPVFESFEVLGLRARLVRRIDEAERLLDQIRHSAEVSSRLLYIQLAWMNRLGSPTWAKKRELLAEIDQLLIGLDVDPDKIAERKRPFLIMVSLDLLLIFQHTLRFRVNHVRRELEQEKSEKFKGPINPSDPEWVQLQERMSALHVQKYETEDIVNDSRLERVADLCREMLDASGLSHADRQALEQVRTEVARLSEDCWREGTITPAAEEYLNKYDVDQQALYKELFPGG